MTREIKFRGKTPEGKWVYGLIVKQREREAHKDGSGVAYTGRYVYSISSHDEPIGVWLVDENTIGQFTGLNDKKGNEIFEGDKMKKPGSDNIYTVVFFDGAFYLKNGGVNHRLSWTTNDGEVIGTIHDSQGNHHSKFRVICRDKSETYVVQSGLDIKEADSISEVLNALADEGEVYYKEEEEEK